MQRGRTKASLAFKPLALLFQALSDEHRLCILALLAKRGEMNVTAIGQELLQSQPAISHHLHQLRAARLIRFRREGKCNYYCLDDDGIDAVIERLTQGGKLDLAGREVNFSRR